MAVLSIPARRPRGDRARTVSIADRTLFDLACRTAEENGWEFNWQLVHAEDVGHTARGMLTAGEIFEALGF